MHPTNYATATEGSRMARGIAGGCIRKATDAKSAEAVRAVGDVVDCRHLSGLFGFGQQLARNLHTDAYACSDNTVRNTRWKLLRPLINGLVRDADGVCGFSDRPPEQFNGLRFEHAVLNHSSPNKATTVHNEDATMVVMTNDLEHRLKLAMRHAGIDVAKLANLTGLTYQGIKKAYDGRTKSMELKTATAIAKVLQCDKHWLAGGDGEPAFGDQSQQKAPDHPAPAPHEAPSDDGKTPPDLVIVQYDAGGAMGHGLELEEAPPGLIKSWRVDHEWLRLNVRHYTSVRNLCIVTGFGPSMKPKYNPGDPLLCDRGVTLVETDGVYFFRVGNHGFIKQLQRIPTEDGIILRAKSFNKDYDPFDITKKMDFEVFGKILTAWCSEQL